jgi:glycosyltransferase involved in cell wall biosynthesis
MKILQILLSQSEAGAETYFEKVAGEFAQRQGVEQHLIIEALPTREKRLDQVDCAYTTLPMDWLGKRVSYNHKLKRAAADFDPDVIFTWVNRASRKAPPCGKVTVGRLGGYYDIANYTRCDHLIVNTPDLVRHVVESGWPEDAVSMISNFGDLPSGLESQEPLPELPADVPVLLTLGRLHVKKAQDVLIRAMPLIPEAHLLIAGDGELLASHQQLAESLGVSDRIHFLGLRKDVAALFRRADICVFPSRFEPLGNVVLEAWAMDTPIVAAASTGPSWLIEDGVNGLLFEIDAHEALAERVNSLLNDPELQKRLVVEGQLKLKRSFSREAVINEYLTLFQGLLDGKIATASR